MLRKLLTLIFLLVAVTPAAMAGVTSVGSSVLEPFLKQWAAKSGGDISISSPGTSTAPKALISGKADLAAMNREMTNDESEAFIRVHGYYPTAIPVAIEAVAVYVHPSNPIKGLELKQLDSLFSASHGCGWSESIATWGQLGLPAPWDKQSIVLLGHNNKSPVRDFFSKTVLCRDDFKPNIEELSHEELLAKVAQNKEALGYGRYQPNNGLKMVPLKKGAGDFVPLTVANLYNKSYRLQHFLFLYIDKPHGKPVSPAVMDFLKTGLSKEGQAAVAEAGYVPLPDELIQRQLSKLK
ncbi:MAG: PstS family phosphate ABC transporter substrate-binding protein [Sulfuricella sp.]